MRGVERMVLSGQPTWPVERTLLTSGALAELLTSRRDGGGRRETPHLVIPYRCDWKWQQPPDPPPAQLRKK